MKTVLQIVEAAGGLASFAWTRIENPPFVPLVIESLGERGPNGHRALIVIESGATRLWPYYFRNDYAGVERWTRQRETDGSMTCRPRETHDLERFMEMWDANIHHQGFVEAFHRAVGQQC